MVSCDIYTNNINIWIHLYSVEKLLKQITSRRSRSEVIRKKGVFKANHLAYTAK